MLPSPRHEKKKAVAKDIRFVNNINIGIYMIHKKSLDTRPALDAGIHQLWNPISCKPFTKMPREELKKQHQMRLSNSDNYRSKISDNRNFVNFVSYNLKSLLTM